ncbi:MAG: HAMP domain-containing sensor histidine kinase [Cyanobacteria bacterium P01_A01_bin.114]
MLTRTLKQGDSAKTSLKLNARLGSCNAAFNDQNSGQKLGQKLGQNPAVADGLYADDVKSEKMASFAKQLGLSAVMTVTCDAQKQYSRLQVRYTSPHFYLSPDILESLQVGQAEWLLLTPLKVVEGNLKGISKGAKGDPWKLYICAYDADASTGYLLIWARRSLSSCQRYCIEQQACLLQQAHRLRQERLQSYHRISLLEQAVQHIEHQLRTPLSLIELYTDLLTQQQSAEGSAEDFQRPLQAIRQLIEEIGVSLKRLARCGLMTQRQPAPCNVQAIIRECLDRLGPKLAQRQLVVLCDQHPLNLSVDGWQMKQVFNNLLSNTVAFSPQGGVVDCRWQVFQKEVLIEICDQGPGFSNEDLKCLFKPFYSRRTGGTGLGLAIAKKIILDHRGSIWANNLPEGGAQISITLPRSLDPLTDDPVICAPVVGRSYDDVTRCSDPADFNSLGR